MKKKFLVLIAALLVVAASFAQKSNNFEVKFNIKGVTAKLAYLSFMGDIDGVKCESYDIAVDEGCFTVKGTTTHTVLARISFVGQDQFSKKIDKNASLPSKTVFLWFIIEPGGKYTVNGSLEGKDFIDLYPTGTAENIMLSKLMSKWMPLANKSANLTLETIRKSENGSKENIANDRAKIKLVNEECTAVKKSFMHSNASSIAALWLVDDMFSRKELTADEVKGFLARVNAKYHSSSYYKTLVTKYKAETSVVVGKKCPVIESNRTIDGKPFSLSKDLKGKFVIVDFWGTWCGPCMGGMASMKKFRDAHADKVEIVGIASEKGQERKDWLAAIKKNELTWPHILCGSGDQNYVAKFNVTGFPTKLLVSPDGTILYRATGESENFYKEVEKLISK